MKRRQATGLALAALVTAAGAAVAPPGVPARAAGPPTITVDRGELRPDGTVVRSRTEVPVTTSSAPRGAGKPAEPTRAPASKLSPALAAVKDPTVRVVVTFQEDRKVPRLPNLDPRQTRAAAANQRVLAGTDAAVADLTSQRQAGYQALTADLATLGVHTLETFWLIRAMVVEAPRAALPALAQRPDVAYVEPVEGGVVPTADTNPNNDEQDARALMGTDPFSGPLTYIGILDTGIRRTHVMLADNVQLGFAEDVADPANPNPDDCFNHGTSVATVITGNAALGQALRGVTRKVVDSFKVYPTNACGSAPLDAVVRGFQRALAVGDRVIVAALAGPGGEIGGLSFAADAAFDAGAVVVAATGNSGPNPGSVQAPGVAHKVLGIGAVDVQTLATPDIQSVGPATDGRVKPDVQAPTNVETGSGQSDTATTVFGGTSAATANAGGMAAVVSDLVRAPNGTIDPGAAYAFMIATGSLAQWSVTQGAGLMQLRPNWAWSVAALNVANQQNVDFRVGNGPNQKLRLAIWWPEVPAVHNDIDVLLIGPDGHTVVGASSSVNNVFERITTSSLTEGVYTIRIHGFNVPSGTQLVHLASINTP